jgi:hypothetical protein
MKFKTEYKAIFEDNSCGEWTHQHSILIFEAKNSIEACNKIANGSFWQKYFREQIFANSFKAKIGDQEYEVRVIPE